MYQRQQARLPGLFVFESRHLPLRFGLLGLLALLCGSVLVPSTAAAQGSTSATPSSSGGSTPASGGTAIWQYRVACVANSSQDLDECTEGWGGENTIDCRRRSRKEEFRCLLDALNSLGAAGWEYIGHEGRGGGSAPGFLSFELQNQAPAPRTTMPGVAGDAMWFRRQLLSTGPNAAATAAGATGQQTVDAVRVTSGGARVIRKNPDDSLVVHLEAETDGPSESIVTAFLKLPRSPWVEKRMQRGDDGAWFLDAVIPLEAQGTVAYYFEARPPGGFNVVRSWGSESAPKTIDVR